MYQKQPPQENNGHNKKRACSFVQKSGVCDFAECFPSMKPLCTLKDRYRFAQEVSLASATYGREVSHIKITLAVMTSKVILL